MRYAILLSILLNATAGFSQEPIRVKVNLVNVSFSVRNSRGALVENLTKDDFEIFEDAIPQKIAFFSRSSDVPLTLGLVVDASGSQEHFSKQHKHDLEVFLQELLGQNDRAFMLFFGNHLRLASDFTRSSSEILDGISRFERDNKHLVELGPDESRDLGTAFYDAIFYSVAEKLAHEKGRRALLIFSDGEDNSSSHDMMTTIETAQDANVILFPIRYTQKEHGRLTARNKYGIRVMDRIAKETGGTTFDGETIDPHTYFHQIGEELRSSYELAYYPTNPIKDDSFRKILIRPKQDGLKVQTKPGYFSR